MLVLKYSGTDGKPGEVPLGVTPVTIGRNPDCTISVSDERASRIHCEIRVVNGICRIRDLQSRNGTYVGDRPVSEAVLKRGDRIGVGNTTLIVEERRPKAARDPMAEVVQEMDDGKGYKTILQSIIKKTRK